MRYTPFESMERMVDQMRRDMMEWRENMWDAWPGDEAYGHGRGQGHGFNVDLSERDDEFVLTVDMPGFEKDEIDLRYDEGHLVMSAVHETSDETSARHRSVSERIALPRDVVEDDISATYRNGVLEVHLPIVEGAEEHGRSIDIR